MKAQAMIGMVSLALLSAGAVAGRAQAYAVGADGQMQQEKQAATIAAENQATTEQLGKLFEVMRIKQQMQAVKQMVPSMVSQQIQTSMKQTLDGLPENKKPTAEQRERMEQLMTKYVGKTMDLYPAD
jgi:dGTP triphosphohydrolase